MNAFVQPHFIISIVGIWISWHWFPITIPCRSYYIKFKDNWRVENFVGLSSVLLVDVKEGVTPILFKVILKPIKIMTTYKKLEQNLKTWARFQDFKILWIEISRHIDKQKIAITRLILKIEDWNFVFRPNFNSRTNHVLQLRLSDQLSKFSFF